jgi:hypothetical protein
VERLVTRASRRAWTRYIAAAAELARAAEGDGEVAIRSLRAAPLFTGGRGRPEPDVAAAARLAASVGDLLLGADLALVELNPVLVYERGATVVDALAARRA